MNYKGWFEGSYAEIINFFLKKEQNKKSLTEEEQKAEDFNKCISPGGMLMAGRIAKHLFPLQELPSGATPFYDKDIDIASIVLEKEENMSKKKMYEDPCNPFSSNYNGTPVGPDSYGGSDFPSWEEDVENLQEEINKEPLPVPSYENSITYTPPRRPWKSTSDILNEINLEREKESKKHEWIQLYTGKKFYPLNPQEEDIDIEDIAHSLSNMCRFTGHCKSFYSVAQHSVLVSYLCGSENALYGLLHDASEAFCVDVPKPLKRLEAFAGYRDVEKKIQEIICKKFNLPLQEPKEVKQADTRMLSTEARDLMAPHHPDWIQPCEPYPFIIVPLPPLEAKKLFLDRYRELNGI